MKHPISIASLIWLSTVMAQSQNTTPIQHVVVIFQENVSFSHYLANLSQGAQLDCW